MYCVTHIDKLRQFILTCLVCGTAFVSAAQSDEQAEPATEEEASVDMVINDKARPRDVLHGDVVKRIYAPQIHDLVVLDAQRLILYVTRSRPYLITLRRKARLLDRSAMLGLERRDSSIDARFDQITVDGFPHSMKRIEKLSVDTAKRLRGIKVDPEPED